MTVRIWDLGLGGSQNNALVHTFHVGDYDMVWVVLFDCLGGNGGGDNDWEDGGSDTVTSKKYFVMNGCVRLASCGKDGKVHIYSTKES